MKPEDFNKQFYPTPKQVIKRMIKKIKGSPKNVLEPSAGKGHIIKQLQKERWIPSRWNNGHGHYGKICEGVSAIEIDQDLQSILRGKHIKVLDSDFLTFSGPDKFDLIIANPPFDHGDQHLLKMIDILYRGQIICLLNAETLKNPHTNIRKVLVQKLNDLGAEIEYLDLAFEDAERPTEVQVALVNIIVERKIEDELFKDVDDVASDPNVEIDPNYEVSTGRRLEELVAEYNQIVTIATETILQYFRNFKKIKKYVGLNVEIGKHYNVPEDLTGHVQMVLNSTVVDIRKDFWRKTLELPDVVKRLTENKRKEFDSQIESQTHMDFTEHNVRSFILNLMKGFNTTLRDAIVAMFDNFTYEHSYRDTPYEKNIHYFNGWKTNNAFKINRRIVIPIYGYGGAFRDYGKWKLAYDAKSKLHDIDIVMNYFDGMEPHYSRISDRLEAIFGQNDNTTSSTYFSKIIAYKKGTLHLTFRDEDILRRFNIEACKGKGWLPDDYGTQRYNLLDTENRDLVDSFEGRDSYTKNFGRLGTSCPKLPQIEMFSEAA